MQRSIVAARKKQWAEYRQAREAALGKPMRRVRELLAVGNARKDTLREIGLLEWSRCRGRSCRAVSPGQPCPYRQTLRRYTWAVSRC